MKFSFRIFSPREYPYIMRVNSILQAFFFLRATKMSVNVLLLMREAGMSKRVEKEKKKKENLNNVRVGAGRISEESGMITE